MAGLTVALIVAAPGVQAEEKSVRDVPPVTDAEIAASVVPIELPVADIDAASSVIAMESERKDGATTVVSLASDVLFDFESAKVAPAAGAKVAQLVKPIPQGAAVKVYGFTDRIGTDAFNLELSRKRAQAVAQLVAKARPDLKLDVQGFGKTQPVADNGTPAKDNPEGRAKNRRVEIRYGG